jgi:hypothetical protein
MAQSGMSEAQQTEARILLKGLLVYRRTSPLTPVIGLALDMDEWALDTLFRDKAVAAS